MCELKIRVWLQILLSGELFWQKKLVKIQSKSSKINQNCVKTAQMIRIRLSAIQEYPDMRMISPNFSWLLLWYYEANLMTLLDENCKLSPCGLLTTCPALSHHNIGMHCFLLDLHSSTCLSKRSNWKCEIKTDATHKNTRKGETKR